MTMTNIELWNEPPVYLVQRDGYWHVRFLDVCGGNFIPLRFVASTIPSEVIYHFDLPPTTRFIFLAAHDAVRDFE